MLTGRPVRLHLPLIALAFCFLAALSAGQTARQMPTPGAPTPGAPLLDASEPEEPQAKHGERLDPETAYGPAIIESMQAVMERERLQPSSTKNHKARNGAQGSWAVPSRRKTANPHSGEHYAINKWGDTRMSVEFGEPVYFGGAWISGQAAPVLWAAGVRFHGYRDGEKVATGAWLEKLSERGDWLAADFENVTRIEIEARPVYQGSGWYGLDDLTFSLPPAEGASERRRVVVDFDDLSYNMRLTGSGYAGLTWPEGTGDFEMETQTVHAPKVPESADMEEIDAVTTNLESSFGGGGTAPVLSFSFAGPHIGNPGAGWLPPDTNGSIGPNHFVAVVNQNLSVYDRVTGNEVISTGLANFWNTQGSAGDPRAVYDHHSNRFIIIATNFNTRLWLAVSLTDDPTGSWFKTWVNLSQGSDASNWPDYPTLGVDATGIYSASYMVGGNSISLFAIDKAPLLTGSPSLGTITAFRNLPWEGAVHPAVTYGTPGRMYCISRRASQTLRLRFVQGPMTNPTLVEAGNVSVPNHGSPPNAPAQGSVAPLDALDWRPMNAVFRNGSLWTTHGVASGGRAACRWYEIDVASVATVQVGTISDPVMSYMMPSISVNKDNSVVVGFSGSSPNDYASSYAAGRTANDPAGQLSPPAILMAGTAPYNTIDSSGVNRWGDYSLTSVDPVDDTAIWTIQEHTRSPDAWGTRVGQYEVPVTCPAPSNFCVTSANSAGTGAVMGYAGDASLSTNSFSLLTVGLPANQPGLFFYAPNQTVTFFGDGLLCLSGQIARLGVVVADQLGFASFTTDMNAPPFSAGPGQVQPGDIRHFQFWYRDPAFGGAGFNLSDGLTVTFCP